MERCIIHLDMDAFFASVEQLDQPDLRGRPVVVGGSSGRGVVSAASYEARPFGIHSAMPTAVARRLCPQAVFLPVRMERYRELSRAVFAIFARYTDRIEPLSIDEAFLDVTGSRRLFGPAAAIAARIRTEVRGEIGLVVSAGIAPNKFLAKLASESAKPDGLLEISSAEIDEFLLPLPVGRLWGVGPKAAARLAAGGIRTVGDLRRLSRQRLERLLGLSGGRLYELCRGIDHRPVKEGDTIKSVGHEDTYRVDLTDPDVIRRELLALSDRVATRLRRKRLCCRRVTLKVKYDDFVAVTRSCTLAAATDHGGEIYRRILELLEHTEAGDRPVRLLGVSLSELAGAGSGQQELFSAQGRKHGSLDRAVDRVRERFGSGGVLHGSLLQRGGSSVREEGGEGDQGE